jgi:crotonobetainyl-CoA:carnitine CoA-transferase CaiB-like acyl-CoA transferase
MASSWYRAGIGYKLTPPGAEAPIGQPAAFVDLMGGMTIAAGMAAARYNRERTGRGCVVDVSLFGVGAWIMSPDILTSIYSGETLPPQNRKAAPNPGVNSYRTKDGRWLALVLLQSDRFWPDLCRRLGRADLAEDERFATAVSRFQNKEGCVAALDETFASRTLAECAVALEDFLGVWAQLQDPREIPGDVQAEANGIMARAVDSGTEIPVVASPVQFGEQIVGLIPSAPGLGEHTDAVLTESGLSWEEIIELKLANVIRQFPVRASARRPPWSE